MKKINSVITKGDTLKLKQSYMNACHDKDFQTYVNSLNAQEDVLMQYTTRLEDAVLEHQHCTTCAGLFECKNSVKGHVFSVLTKDNSLDFSYVPCRYLEQEEQTLAYQKKITCFDLPREVKMASFKNIYKDDKNRVPIIKFFQEFMTSYLQEEKKPGLYLYGSFGSGKTYLIAALFNELAKKGVSSALVYYPELLRSLKASFNTGYEERFEFIKRAPLLLLDDVGAENTTAWSRDEVLGPILQFRMEEHLPTFFTSNLTLTELEKSLSTTSNGIEKIKAKRIVERIRQLTTEMELVSENRRH